MALRLPPVCRGGETRALGAFVSAGCACFRNSSASCPDAQFSVGLEGWGPAGFRSSVFRRVVALSRKICPFTAQSMKNISNGIFYLFRRKFFMRRLVFLVPMRIYLNSSKAAQCAAATGRVQSSAGGAPAPYGGAGSRAAERTPRSDTQPRLCGRAAESALRQASQCQASVAVIIAAAKKQLNNLIIQNDAGASSSSSELFSAFAPFFWPAAACLPAGNKRRSQWRHRGARCACVDALHGTVLQRTKSSAAVSYIVQDLRLSVSAASTNSRQLRGKSCSLPTKVVPRVPTFFPAHHAPYPARVSAHAILAPVLKLLLSSADAFLCAVAPLLAAKRAGPQATNNKHKDALLQEDARRGRRALLSSLQALVRQASALSRAAGVRSGRSGAARMIGSSGGV